MKNSVILFFILCVGFMFFACQKESSLESEGSIMQEDSVTESSQETVESLSENETIAEDVWNPIVRDEATIAFEDQINAIHQEYFDQGNDSCWDGDYRKVTVDDRSLSFFMEDIGNADVPCMCHLRDAEVLVFIKENIGDFYMEDTEVGDKLYKIKNSDSIFFLISVDENNVYKVWTFERFLKDNQPMGLNPDIESW